MKFVATLLASTIAFVVTVGGAQAQDDQTQAVLASSAPSSLTRAEVAADLKAYRESGLADLDRVDVDRALDQTAREQATQRYQRLRAAAGLATQAPAVAFSGERSRADVLAELKAYRESGLADLNRVDAELPADAQARVQAEQRYQQLLSAARARAMAAK